MNNIFTALGVIFILIICYLMMLTPGTPTQEYINTVKPWPPEYGKKYPNLELIDQSGKTFNLHDFENKVVLINLVGMGNPISQAMAGAEIKGALGKIQIPENSSSLEELLVKFNKGLVLPHPDLIIVHLLMYDFRFKKPKIKAAKLWAKHFDLKVSDNEIVAFSPYDLRSAQTFNLIPSLQLIDKKSILQEDVSILEIGNKYDSLEKLFSLVGIALKQK